MRTPLSSLAMPRILVTTLLALCHSLHSATLHAQQEISFALTNTRDLTLLNVRADTATYRGRLAVRIMETEAGRAEYHSHAILARSTFSEGTIEIDVAGSPRAGADTSLRGFVGLAFHVQPGGEAFKAFYLRPTNARSVDQLRRNHATQFIAEPGYPWDRLRREQPGVYEAYADMEAGAWTHLKIVVTATSARLFVNGADQPTLIINDMKVRERGGRLALWIGNGTEAYFSNLVIREGKPE